MIYIYMYSYIVPFMYGHVVHVCMHYIYIYQSIIDITMQREKTQIYLCIVYIDTLMQAPSIYVYVYAYRQTYIQNFQ